MLVVTDNRAHEPAGRALGLQHHRIREVVGRLEHIGAERHLSADALCEVISAVHCSEMCRTLCRHFQASRADDQWRAAMPSWYGTKGFSRSSEDSEGIRESAAMEIESMRQHINIGDESTLSAPTQTWPRRMSSSAASPRAAPCRGHASRSGWASTRIVSQGQASVITHSRTGTCCGRRARCIPASWYATIRICKM